jgi:hypothetical protein
MRRLLITASAVLSLAMILTAAPTGYAEDKQRAPQQQRMVDCNADEGQEPLGRYSEGLHVLVPQARASGRWQGVDLATGEDEDLQREGIGQNLEGDARKQFMSAASRGNAGL